MRKIVGSAACAHGMRACAGDLAQPQLGLSQAVYDSLCAELDTIVHNGALVNHAYSYEQLFEPNVLGSVEVSGPFPVPACPALPHAVVPRGLLLKLLGCLQHLGCCRIKQWMPDKVPKG